MSEPLAWEPDGADWPNRAASRFVEAAGLKWHVQIAGDGPCVLLIHGTGASTHSWRDVLPAISAAGFRVVALDLPGHGFTSAAPTSLMTLRGMATGIAACLKVLDVAPLVTVGHSAGAAVALEMSLDDLARPRTILSFNGALRPFRGVGRHAFPWLAKLLFLNAFTPALFAWRAQSRAAVAHVLAGTGSQIDARGIDLYAKLFRSRAHVAATLAMMANWDLEGLTSRLPALKSSLVLVVGTADRAVPPDDAFAVRPLVPHARVQLMRGLGHLAHEEDPAAAAELICAAAREAADTRSGQIDA